MGQWKALRAVALTPRILSATIIVAGYLFCLAMNLPGQLSYDSIAQLHDGRTGVYNAWHPPVMAWLLGVADAVVPGTALFVIFVAAILFVGLLSLLWVAEAPSWATVAIAAVCVLLPQFLIYQGIVWKDVLFANCAIVGFICIAHAGARWGRVPLRHLLLSCGIIFLVLAALARQNGVIALVFGIGAIGVLAATRSASRRATSFLFCGAGSATVAFVLIAAATWALALRTPGESGTHAQLKLLENYDLVGAVKEEPQLALPILGHANPDLEELIRTDGVRLYTPERNDTLVGSPDLQNELIDTQQSQIAAQWRQLVVHHPALYMTVRERVFWWTFGTPDINRCYPFFVGVQGFPPYMHDLGLVPRKRPQDFFLTDYGTLFVGTPVFSHLSYAVLAIVLLVVLLRRHRPADLAMGLLLLSALAFTLSFFVISIACDYRYLVFLDLSALTGAFHLAASCPKTA